MSNNKSRYRTLTRRRFLRSSAIGGLAAVFPGLACSTSTPATAPATSTSLTSTSPTSTTPTAPATSSSVVEETAPDTSPAPDTSETSPTSAETGQVLGELVVDFSYVASSSGRVHSPYIAVWVEDAAGDLVRTVSLWYKSNERKYLRDLRRWNDADGQSDAAVTSGATRLPGTYSVMWDATTSDGSPIPTGEYHICIEASREDGPYELIREAITLDGTPFTAQLPDDGELTEASVTFVA